MTESNRQVLLASRPEGKPTESNFRLVDGPVPSLGEGQVLVRNQWLSIDPYMRGRMMDIRTYADPVALGDVMVGDTAGIVVESRHPGFAVGDAVAGHLGWDREKAPYRFSEWNGDLRVLSFTGSLGWSGSDHTGGTAPSPAVST